MRAHLVYLVYKITLVANFLAALVSARQVGERIVNGQNATQGQFPYQVSWLADNDEHICGGSIFTETTIITAAHCCEIDDWGKWPFIHTKIVAGGLSLQVPLEFEQITYVKSHIIHPEYNSLTFPHYQHDICLLSLYSPLQLIGNVSKIFLDEEDPVVDTKCLVSGWGALTVSIPCSDNRTSNLHFCTSLEWGRIHGSSMD